MYFSGDAFNDLANGNIPLTDNVVNAITQSMNSAFDSVAPETRKHIGEFYAQMMPSVEELKTSMKGLDQIPQAYANVFMQSSAIGAVGKNATALKDLGVTALSTVLPSDVTKVLESSKKYGDSFTKGIKSNENNVRTAAENLRKLVVNTLSKSIDISVPVNVTGKVNTKNTGGNNNNNDNDKKAETTKNNAVGTTYFGGGLTTINEHGYEVIDLPQGTRIYPHSKSEKMLNNNSPNISVSVNVNGNIFGLENAAELIGEMVCEKVVDVIKEV